MEIRGSSLNRPGATQGTRLDLSGGQAKVSTGPAPAGAGGLRAIIRQLIELPDVDLSRVQDMRDALASGRFVIDDEKVADGVIEYEKAMIHLGR